MTLSLKKLKSLKTRVNGRGLTRYQEQNASNENRLNIQNQNLTHAFSLIRSHCKYLSLIASTLFNSNMLSKYTRHGYKLEILFKQM